MTPDPLAPPPGPPTPPAATPHGGGAVVPPPGLDRLAVERVLARATELQLGTPDGTGLLTEEQILDLGREVGLSPAALRQALAEERTRLAVPAEGGAASRLFGPRVVHASRTVPGTPASVLALLDVWMSRDECLQSRRRFPDRATWEPRRDLVGSLRRGLNLGGRGYALTRAAEVGATVVSVDDARALVRLDADISPSRNARVQGSIATAATGVVTGGTLAALASMVVVGTAAAAAAVATVAALPVVAGAGIAYAVARGHAGTAARVQLALEQLLDRLEHERPGGRLPPTGRPW
jgi:hypothetical protein